MHVDGILNQHFSRNFSTPASAAAIYFSFRLQTQHKTQMHSRSRTIVIIVSLNALALALLSISINQRQEEISAFRRAVELRARLRALRLRGMRYGNAVHIHHGRPLSLSHSSRCTVLWLCVEWTRLWICFVLFLLYCILI